jgi:twitching motility protein PilT
MLQRDESIAQVCAHHGYLNREQVEQVLRYRGELVRRLHVEAHLFGRVAMSLNLLTKEQLEECLKFQRTPGFVKRLGETAIERGFLSQEQVGRILERQREVKEAMVAEVPIFGKIAMELGMLAAHQLEECVRAQHQEGSLRRLGEICVERRFMTPEDVKLVLQRQSEARAAAKRPSLPPPAPEQPVVTGDQQARFTGEHMDDYLHLMIEKGASDLHIATHCVPRLRIHGDMLPISNTEPLGPADVRELLMAIIPGTALREFETRHDVDFAYVIEGTARFRVNYYVARHGMGAVIRQIPFEVLTTEQIGLSPEIVELCWLPKGLVLVTGPTGSGKSTTLAALVDFINRNRSDHIITIEDPIEFVHTNKKCLITQREIGAHTGSFKTALRAALREDPDVVLVGELRDLETVAIAMETAETGHLVFGTLHTTSAAGTVDRIIDQFPAGEQAQIRSMLAESLRGVVAQMLCKKVGGGRVPAFEFLLSTPAVANLIREGKTEQLPSVMQTGKSMGMQTMNDHLLELVKTGLVTPREAYVKSTHKRHLKERFDQERIELPDDLAAGG